MDSRRRGRLRVLTAPSLVAALCIGLLVAARATDPAPSARSWAAPLGPEGSATLAVSTADLDGDGRAETVALVGDAIEIADGPHTYRTRARWSARVVGVGDTDRDGSPEVVALLESAEGLHLGLIAWRVDRYRERMVTSPLVPPPTSLAVRYDRDSRGDVVQLGEPGGSVTTYRWNGFGFTAVRSERDTSP